MVNPFRAFRRAATSALALAAFCLASLALPGQAHANTCHWKVIWSTAGVYPEPSRSYASLKTKHAGDIVGPYCDTVWNYTWGEYYTAVHCTCDTWDNVGWMRRAALTSA
jgi:hypothetical protein